jgi:hypothetical protein
MNAKVAASIVPWESALASRMHAAATKPARVFPAAAGVLIRRRNDCRNNRDERV